MTNNKPNKQLVQANRKDSFIYLADTVLIMTISRAQGVADMMTMIDLVHVCTAYVAINSQTSEISYISEKLLNFVFQLQDIRPSDKDNNAVMQWNALVLHLLDVAKSLDGVEFEICQLIRSLPMYELVTVAEIQNNLKL